MKQMLQYDRWFPLNNKQQWPTTTSKKEQTANHTQLTTHISQAVTENFNINTGYTRYCKGKHPTTSFLFQWIAGIHAFGTFGQEVRSIRSITWHEEGKKHQGTNLQVPHFLFNFDPLHGIWGHQQVRRFGVLIRREKNWWCRVFTIHRHVHWENHGCFMRYAYILYLRWSNMTMLLWHVWKQLQYTHGWVKEDTSHGDTFFLWRPAIMLVCPKWIFSSLWTRWLSQCLSEVHDCANNQL